MKTTEQDKVMDAFWRWREALVRLDAVDAEREKAKAELESVEGELRALARKGGS